MIKHSFMAFRALGWAANTLIVTSILSAWQAAAFTTAYVEREHCMISFCIKQNSGTVCSDMIKLIHNI